MLTCRDTPNSQSYWYRQHPYNKHSYILYDILRNNELSSSNFNFAQNVSYTYFNATSQSYIDHVFTSTGAGDIIKRCSILSDLPTNVSDHYPLLTTAEIQVQSNIKHKSSKLPGLKIEHGSS